MKIKSLIFSVLAIFSVSTTLYSKDLVIGIGGDIAVYEPPVIYPKVKTNSGALVGDATDLKGTIFESWKAHNDGLTYTIKIRKGLKLHNGKRIDAKLVHYMFDRNLNTPGGGAWLLKNIAFVTKPPQIIDDYTIKLVGDKPSPMVMSSLYMTSSSMIDPEIVKNNATSEDKWATKWMTRNIAGGSGPYKIVKHIPDQEVVFEAWDDYPFEKPKIKRMIWKIIPSAAQRALLLKSGVIDIAEGLGEEEFKSLKGANGVKIITAPSGNLIYLGMNSSIPPFNDVKVRRAVSYAVDYNDILKNVYNGDAKRLWGPFSGTNSLSLGSKAGYRTDVAKAKSILGSSSYKGEKVTISIDSSKADRELIAVRIQASMRSIGMNAEIEKLTPAVYSERKVGKKLQMTIDGMNAWIDDPNYSLSLTLECGVYGNYMDYCNKEVDSIIKNGWAETDSEKRRKMFERAQRIIIDDAPWAFIAQPNFKLAMKDGLGGYVHYTNEIPRYHHYFWK